MKFLTLLSVALTLSLSNYAQTDTTTIKKSPPDFNDHTRDNLNKTNDDGYNPNHHINDNENKEMNKITTPDVKTTADKKINQKPGEATTNDCITLNNGKIMLLKNGKLTKIDKTLTLGNGTTVNSDGTITGKDGSKIILDDKSYMDMSGKILPITNLKNKNK